MMYKIDAVDTLVFRTANPFDAGVNFHAYSQFPPFPSVYAGALRRGEKIAARDIKIGFSGLLLNGKYAFPQPLDTLVTEQQTLQSMKLSKSYTSSHELDWMLAPAQEIEKKVNVSGGAYLVQADFENYLNGSNQVKYEALGDYVTKESHIGIEMEHETHKTKDGMWYSEELIRLKNQNNNHCSLVVDAEGFTIDNQATVKIGGDTKLATVTKIEELSIPEPSNPTNYFKLYLATPAVFKYGWLPRWIDPETKVGSFTYRKNQVKVRLVAAAIDKPVPIGGYSENGPRPMHLAVPAGSVYYFELLEGTHKDAIKLFHQKCISDYRSDNTGKLGFDYIWWNRLVYCDRGFGYAFVGKVKEEVYHDK